VLAVAALFTGPGAVVALASPGDISFVAGVGSAGYSGDGGPATDATLHSPQDVDFDAGGRMLIADQGNNVIRRVDTSGIISTVVGTGAFSSGGDGGPATAATLRAPTEAIADAAGNLYIADTSGFKIRKVDHSSGIITTIAGNGSFGYSGDGGPATAAEMQYPQALTLDASNNLLIADCSGAIRKVDQSSGIISRIAGTGSVGNSGAGGPATSAEIGCPSGVKLNASNDLIFSDGDNNIIHRVDHSTGIISTIAGSGSRGYSGDGGPATAAEMNGPLQVALDSSGNIYVAEYGNGVIRRIDSSGVINTVAGGQLFGSQACQAQFGSPEGVALDSSGNMYIGNTRGNEVDKVVPPFPTCIHPVSGVVTDFNRDFVSDISVFRPSSGTWFVHPSGGGADTGTAYGASGDIPVPGDYDGDYTADVAIFRPSTGLWAIHNSSGGDTFVTYGMAGDVPVPGDYDGDGKTDIAIFRPSNGFWYVHRSSDGSDHATMFGGGVNGDIPVPGDYDGDGRTDFAIFRPSSGTWYINPSGADHNDLAITYGASGDIPIPGDYDGDHITDIAVRRPSTGLFAIHPSGGGADTFLTYGIGSDVPIPGDYDGDHLADIAVFRPSTGAWFVHKSTNHTDAITTFGVSSDIPLQLPAAIRRVFFP
jgi:sugar lactone lactonase YvrE